MKRTLSILLIAFLVCGCILLPSCNEESEYPVTIGDITLTEEPESIVILDKNIADIISALGYDDKAVGISDSVDQEGYSVVPSFGPAHDPSAKEIKSSGAQAVFADKVINESTAEALEKADIPVFRFEQANTLKQLSDIYKKIGTILGGKVTGAKKAAKIFKKIKNSLGDLKRSAKSEQQIVKTLAYLYIDEGVLKTAAPGSWEASVLDYTGCVNIFKSAEGDVADAQALLLANPDYLFVSDESVSEYLMNSESLYALNALEGNTFVVDIDDLNTQGKTVVDVVEKMINDIRSVDKNDEVE